MKKLTQSYPSSKLLAKTLQSNEFLTAKTQNDAQARELAS